MKTSVTAAFKRKFYFFTQGDFSVENATQSSLDCNGIGLKARCADLSFLKTFKGQKRENENFSIFLHLGTHFGRFLEVVIF